ncbi:MAG: hypothetical protein LWX11_05740 [Firmicutes bacterium]|nr:hypothetical protein [Bacillota bacterium]
MPDWEELRDWLRERLGLLVALALAVAVGLYFWLDRPMKQPPGVLAPAEPLQELLPGNESWQVRTWRLTALATFEIQARVLSRERYRFDTGSDFCPLDLALGWGPMSDSAVLKAIHISQSDRWYHWSTSSTPPIPPDQITAHSANMHMIPANDRVKRILLGFREGEVIHLKGKLVRVDRPDGYSLVSSLSRLDSGAGSCEVVWVEEAGS